MQFKASERLVVQAGQGNRRTCSLSLLTELYRDYNLTKSSKIQSLNTLPTFAFRVDL